jgi:rod shape-determining protein MreD
MKAWKIILHFLLMVAFLIIQVTFFEQLKLFNLSFDLILIAVLAVTLVDGVFYSIIFGFVIGLIFDLIAGDLPGISALLYPLDAFIMSRLLESGFKKKLISLIFIIFILTETNIISESIIRYLFNFEINLQVTGVEMLLAPVCNIILLAVLYPAIKASINRGMETFEFKYKDKI